jgi:hypothetical protein
VTKKRGGPNFGDPLASCAREMDGGTGTSWSARQFKVSAMYPTDERLPFAGCELEDWPLAVFGVADRDSTVNERHFHTRPIVAESARAPHYVVEMSSAAGWLCHGRSPSAVSAGRAFNGLQS